jgi:hypothetical protein
MSTDLQVQRMQHTRILAACGLLMGGVPVVSGFEQRGDPVVRAERLELVTEQGLRRAILTADSVGLAVTLLDRNGRPAGALLLSEEPRVSVVTGRGREVAGLGAPKVHPLTE